MKIKETLESVYHEFNVATASKRRELLVEQMKANESSGNDCMSCTGKCCTFVSNSMQMTSLEALEALYIMEEKNLLTSEVKKRLEDSVKNNRLDNLIQISNDEYFRRTYTCPFYFFPDFGCGLGIDHKPYGCIAFNPCSPAQKEGGNCASDLEIQQKRNDLYKEDEEIANEFLLNEKGIDLLKKPIPLKLLELWNILLSSK